MPGIDEADFQFLADNSTDIICRADLDMALLYVSPSSMHILGFRPEDMIGRTAEFFVLPEDAGGLAPFCHETSAPGLENVTSTLRMRRKDGLVAFMEVNRRVMRDAVTGEPREIVFVMRDITERRKLEESLAALILIDPATGLATRPAFDKALEREWNRIVREGSRLSILLVDFNFATTFHGAQEHLDGDGCLSKAAAAVMGVLRTTDLAARYHGEIIAVSLPSTGPSGAGKVAEKIRAAIGAIRSPDNQGRESNLALTAVIGITSMFARSGGSVRMPELLLLAAEHALIKARRLQAFSLRQNAHGGSSGNTHWKTSMPGGASASL